MNRGRAAPTTLGAALAALAAAGSAGLLAAAFAFQYGAGLAPCPICIWQRWPHAAALALGFAMLAPALRGARWLRALGAAAMAAGAGIALYHTGIERTWWQGPSTCSGGPGEAASTEALLDAIMAAPIVRCTDVAWELAGLSMASWNGLGSLALAGLWLAAARRP